ncbi:MAG: BatA domain-containing protein [Planctomycetaceae bacterium]|nr:BatA domain-containing protein [Planctomycetaceae bacterium]
MFVYQSLLWFLPLLGLVVLIHLINMFRHRRVEWAAIEFLLASYKRSRTRILMQQLLLLLLRMLVVAAVILMLAQPKLEGVIGDLLGGKVSHHIILLDDSYSMNDRNTAQGGGVIFDDALGVIKQIIDNAARHNGNDKLTLIRLSKTTAINHGNPPDFAEITLNEEGIQNVRDMIKTLYPSQGSFEPADMFEPAAGFVRQSAARSKPVVYFISDFRSANWQNHAEILKKISEIRTLGGTVRMIRSVDDERVNLGITSMRLVDGIHAADVEMLIDAGIINYGHDDADNVHLSVLVDDVAQTGITIPRIKAGELLNPPLRFPVRFSDAGTHRVEIKLQPDAIADDNNRTLAVNVPAAIEILLISPERRAGTFDPAQFVRIALAPSSIKSGIRTRTEPPAFLAANPLKQYSAIFLLEAVQLEQTAVNALEEYATNGGGVAIFTGADSNIDFIRTTLYNEGKGIFPFAPIAVSQLEADLLTNKPDINVVGNHPIFRLFSEGDSPLLAGVKIEKYLAVSLPKDQKNENKNENENKNVNVNILANLRNGQPLVVEKNFGNGRVITFLTSVSPVWNNWGKGNPSFVVVMLELAASLSDSKKETDQLLIGNAIPISVDSSLFEPKVEVRIPPREGVSEGSVVKIDLINSDDGLAKGIFDKTDAAGFYEVQLKQHSEGAGKSVELYAVNVQAKEGEMSLMDLSELANLARSVKASLESAAGFSTSFEFAANASWSDIFLYILIIFMMAETFLAGRIIPPSKRNNN